MDAKSENILETIATFKYFHIDLIECKTKTNVYHIYTNKKVSQESGVILEGYAFLGKIVWSPRWRQYVFRFVPDMYDSDYVDFSRDCFRDIITFIQKLMDERKRKQK